MPAIVLLPQKPVPRLFTVGRLDVQSVGLIFITNDGEWASRYGAMLGGSVSPACTFAADDEAN